MREVPFDKFEVKGIYVHVDVAITGVNIGVTKKPKAKSKKTAGER